MTPAGGRSGAVLSVWAHPDDETYLCAGLMARAVDEGRRVVCVTATRGEQGTSDPGRWPPGQPLAAVRTAELERALETIGVIEHHWLDYPDGGCAGIDDGVATARIRALAVDVDADTVLTFGPEGMTGHADHQAVSRWTTSAVADLSVDLHYATNTPDWLARFREPLDALDVFMGVEPPCTPLPELSMHVVLDGSDLDRKVAALRAQTSQIEGMVQALGWDFLREGLAEEAFRPAP